MSKLETNTIDTVSGTTNLTIGSTNTSSITLGASGDTITVPSGTMSGQNYPAFVAYRSPSSQSIPSGVNTKAIFDTKLFDTDSAYDTSTGAFTVPSGKGGKYNIFFTIFIDDLDDQDVLLGIIYKNGSATTNPVYQNQIYASGGTQNIFLNFSSVISLSDSDYIEVYIQHNQGANQNLRATHSHFGAYRIGS